MFRIIMPTSLEVEREISERAERRKQELREALGGGLLITNNLSFHDKGMLINNLALQTED